MLMMVVRLDLFWKKTLLVTKSHHGDQSSREILKSQKGKMNRGKEMEASLFSSYDQVESFEIVWLTTVVRLCYLKSF